MGGVDKSTVHTLISNFALSARHRITDIALTYGDVIFFARALSLLQR